MTDNEIIKAFKDFLNEQVDGYTDHVETGGERYEFIEKELELLKETDNLINRQKAEIERLREEKSKLENKIDEMYPLVMQLPNAMQQAKVEAIKEFAERVKLEFYYQFDELIPSIMADKIDNLVKEMVGDN